MSILPQVSEWEVGSNRFLPHSDNSGVVIFVSPGWVQSDPEKLDPFSTITFI